MNMAKSISYEEMFKLNAKQSKIKLDCISFKIEKSIKQNGDNFMNTSEYQDLMDTFKSELLMYETYSKEF